MTVKKQTKCNGLAAITARHRIQNPNQHIDPSTLAKSTVNFNISVCFNEKDQLQLTSKDETKDDKRMMDKKVETIKIDEITNCVNVDSYNCTNTLVFYLTRNSIQEAIALKFENENDFKRIYFTYKYFKMRNRLTNSSNNASNENLLSKKKVYNDTLKIRKISIENYDKTPKSEFDLHQTTDNNGVTHISVHQKNSRFDQPLSLIGIRSANDFSEVDSLIYADDYPIKPEKKTIFQKLKPPAPSPPSKENSKILKGQFVRVNVDRVPDLVPKEIRVSRIPDILAMKEKTKIKTKNTNNNVWGSTNKGVTGYESDREEWRSRSQFSTTAFDSLSRPAKTAMALTLRKPQQRPAEMQPPPYYRFGDIPFTRLNNYTQKPPRIPRPMDIKRNPLNIDHRKFTSLQNLDFQNDVKKPEKRLTNISNKISGLTSKLRDFGTLNTLGRFRAQSQTDVTNLKPVIKKNVGDGTKRSVVRTCSVEPPKKVTFSAFATVQVV